MNKLQVEIDSSNIRRSEVRPHLIKLLKGSFPVQDGFSEVCVWGFKKTLQKLLQYSWLKKEWSPALDGNLISRSLWRKFYLINIAQNSNYNVLFIPDCSFSSDFPPFVTMRQNMLPFEWHKLWRYGFSLLMLKLILLRFVEQRT